MTALSPIPLSPINRLVVLAQLRCRLAGPVGSGLCGWLLYRFFLARLNTMLSGVLFQKVRHSRALIVSEVGGDRFQQPLRFFGCSKRHNDIFQDRTRRLTRHYYSGIMHQFSFMASVLTCNTRILWYNVIRFVIHLYYTGHPGIPKGCTHVSGS